VKETIKIPEPNINQLLAERASKKNLLCTRPLVFGDTEQIRALRCLRHYDEEQERLNLYVIDLSVEFDVWNDNGADEYNDEYETLEETRTIKLKAENEQDALDMAEDMVYDELSSEYGFGNIDNYEVVDNYIQQIEK
jgi:hypothetical protein